MPRSADAAARAAEGSGRGTRALRPPRLHAPLRRGGREIDHRRTCRLYGAEGLSIRTRTPRRRRACRHRSGRAEAGGADDVRAKDFMSHRLFDGRPFRIPTVVDRLTRGALPTAPRPNRRGCRVVDELDRLHRLRGRPRSVRVDDGPELAGRPLTGGPAPTRSSSTSPGPGKPGDDACVGALDDRLRQECLDASRFPSTADARARIEARRIGCDRNRTHPALGGSTPAEFADQLRPARKVA